MSRGVAGGEPPFVERFERLRGHTPPPQLPADLSCNPGRQTEHCNTRSELLNQRRLAYIAANEERKRAHEEANPTWAATLTVTAGERKPTFNRTQTQLKAERRQDRVATSVLASGDGILERDKNIMLAADPTALVTTISRPDAYGPMLPMTYVEDPKQPTRSELLQTRKHELVQANAQTMRRIGQEGYRSFYQRVGDRLDSSLKSYYDSQEAGGQKLTRNQLLAHRKADFIAENEDFLSRHRAGEVREPKYADQSEPFWTLGREVPMPAINSRNELLEAQQWYRKPEVYVPGREPREPDPFKIGEAARLADKLSSGPRRFQRGYPAERREIAGKITDLPAPDPSTLTTADQRKATVKETLRYLHFKIHTEQRMGNAGQIGPDLAMEKPMYSSFTRDRIFREPSRAPRPRTMMSNKQSPERQTAGMTRPFSSTAGDMPRSPMLMSTFGPSKPGTAASVRSGGFQVIDSLMATR